MDKEYLITILGQRRAGNERKKGIVRPSRRSQILSRRIKKGIRIYDCGYIKVGGEWTTLDWVDNIFVDLPLAGSGSSIINDEYTETLSRYQNLADKVLEVPLNEFNRTYKRINTEYIETLHDSSGLATGGDYSIAAYYNGYYNPINPAFPTFDTLWVGNAYRPSTDAQPFPSAIFSWNMGTLGFVDYFTNFGKVTAEYDFSAPAVDFVPSEKMEVYLMPSPVYVSAFTTYTVTGSLVRTRSAIAMFLLLPRHILFNPAHPDYTSAINLFYGGDKDYSSGASYSNPSAVYSAAVDAVNFLVDTYQYPGRVIQQDIALPGVTYSYSDPGYGGFVEGGLFPTPSGYTNITIAADFTWRGTTMPSGILLGIIKKDGQYYYVWDD